MYIGCARLQFRAEWVHSLKEKRMIVKSLVEKTRHKFNASVSEIECLDNHKIIVVAACCVSNSAVLSEQMINNIVDFMELNTDAMLDEVDIEVMQS